MKLAFDHIVHFANDPVQAAAILRENGLHALEGGRHSNWGTYNSLSYFDLSYVEFLGIFDRSLAETETKNLLVRDIAGRLPDREGFATLALRTNDIEHTAVLLKSRGLGVIGPFPGSRTRPDGKVIEWSMLFIESEHSVLPLPFFIQWGEEDNERRIDLQERGVIAPHTLGNLALRHVLFAVRDLDQRISEWSSWFSLEAGEAYFDPALQATCRTLQLPGGNLVFSSPTGDGVVATILAERGETPFALVASGAQQNQIVELAGGTYTFVASNEQL
ncbi:MAG: VOC family protein [Clostridia bacterium]